MALVEKLIAIRTNAVETIQFKHLKKLCKDTNRTQSDMIYDFVFVNEERLNKYSPISFSSLVTNFRQYKED